MKLPKEISSLKQSFLYTLGGVGVGLMLAAAFTDIARWQVTAGISLVVASIVLRYFFEK